MKSVAISLARAASLGLPSQQKENFMTTASTITPAQADRVAMAAYYLHPLIANPSLAEGVLADDWEKGCSDCERAFLETLARHRINALAALTNPSEAMVEAVAAALYGRDRSGWIARHPDDNFNLWEENCKAFQDDWRNEATAALSVAAQFIKDEQP